MQIKEEHREREIQKSICYEYVCIFFFKVEFISETNKYKSKWTKSMPYVSISVNNKVMKNCYTLLLRYNELLRNRFTFAYHKRVFISDNKVVTYFQTIYSETCIMRPLSRKTTWILRPPFSEQTVLIMY